MIPYQVDYSVKNTAKTLGFSKKRVIFKFGFASQHAINDGLTGAHCRGSEHEVTFIWSLKTGKRQLFLDGKDVHFSESGQNGWTQDRAWQHIFPLKDREGTFRVHFISQPINKELPDSKPFDLRVSGISYFAFNEIFKLGTPAMTVRDSSSRGGHRSGGGRSGVSEDAYMSPEERRQIAAAKVESLRDFREQQERQRAKSPGSAPGGGRSTAESATPQPAPAPAASMNREENSLISFEDDAPAPLSVTAGGANNYSQLASSITLDPAIDNRQAQQQFGQQLQQQPQQPTPFGQPPQQEFAQQPVQQPYGIPSYGQPQATSPVPTGMASMALTPYQAPGGQPAPSPYVDSTGRLSMGQPSPQQPPQQPYNNYSMGAGNPAAGFDPMASPASYGSAPSFAQPPPPQQQQQQQQPAYHAQQAFASPQGSGYGAPAPGGFYAGNPPPQQGSFAAPADNTAFPAPAAPAPQGYPGQPYYNPNQTAY